MLTAAVGVHHLRRWSSSAALPDVDDDAVAACALERLADPVVLPRLYTTMSRAYRLSSTDLRILSASSPGWPRSVQQVLGARAWTACPLRGSLWFVMRRTSPQSCASTTRWRRPRPATRSRAASFADGALYAAHRARRAPARSPHPSSPPLARGDLLRLLASAARAERPPPRTRARRPTVLAVVGVGVGVRSPSVRTIGSIIGIDGANVATAPSSLSPTR